VDGSAGLSVIPFRLTNQIFSRAHNAMDPNVMARDNEKIVYNVHLEPGVQVQVGRHKKERVFFSGRTTKVRVLPRP
jgi:hypothetical protein